MLKSKSFYVSIASVLCALLVVGITSMAINSGGDNEAEDDKSYLESDNKQDKDEVLDISGEIGAKENETEEVVQDEFPIGDETNGDNKEIEKEESETNKKPDTSKKNTKNNRENIDAKTKAETTMVNKGLTFNEENGLVWPVNGDVIMSFSADEMVYYETLGQFMKSDKILIEASVGDKVKACAEGIVTDITDTRQTGKTVTMSIGSGYDVVYGELDNVTVKKGDKVKSGQIIGTVSTPSGYYSKEGTNLYFKVVQNDVPVNPMYLLK